MAEIEDLLAKAESALEASKGEEANEYAEQILKIDPESSEAWMVKMKAVEGIGLRAVLTENKAGIAQVQEAMSYGDNAIKYSANKDKTSEEIYTYYIEWAQRLLITAITGLKDIEKIKQLVDSGASDSDIFNADSESLVNLNLAPAAIQLKRKIPNEYIATHTEMQNKVTTLASEYSLMCETHVNRIAIYNCHIKDDEMAMRQAFLNVIKEGLPAESANRVYDEGVSQNNSQSSGGCYIATCVYGSYDCPQVWTLRRFRDDTLDATWYGSVFIKCYYAVSPLLVKYFGATKWFRTFWKSRLDKMVANLNRKGVDDTYYQDQA